MILITAQRNNKMLPPYTTHKRVDAHAKATALRKTKNTNSIIMTVVDQFGTRCKVF